MRRTDRLYTYLGSGGKIYDFSSNAIEWDSTWTMQNNPYPPEPSYNFYIEDAGIIIKILEIWRGYFEALFDYAEKAELLNNDLGKIWYEFCWIGNNDDDWLLEGSDLNDFISICEKISFFDEGDEQQKVEQNALSETQILNQLRAYLIQYFETVSAKKYLVYFNKD